MLTKEKFEQLFLKEPAKTIGWILAFVISACAMVVAILNNVVDVLPEDWKPEVNKIVATTLLIGIIVTRIQAVITRAKVYAPMTVMSDPKLPAIEGTTPGHTPQGGPQTEEEVNSALEELRAQLGIQK